MQIIIKIIFTLLLCSYAFVFAQTNHLNNQRLKKIATKGAVLLDDKSIIPNSLFITNIDSNYFSLDAVNAILTWKKAVALDSVYVYYRVFPFNFNATAKGFNYDSIKNNFIVAQTFIFNNKAPQVSNNNLFNFGNVNYSGSFGRSLSFGNNQDAVFNSQLNLQLNGLISDSVKIAAAITDNNIPIQPDGNTQRLNEFDRILLQFSKRNWELSLGDIDLRQNNQYFLNFYKRLQGFSYSNTNKQNNNLTIAGAIAKGKFSRNSLMGLEGNQGPYRLQTPNNDFFFIILAGSERVFIDGELLQRGEDQDYVINYNTAEITFTPKRMITKDKRLQFEFEYADRNYLNSVIYASKDFTPSKKIKINVAAYSNVDAKNSPINQDLNTFQKQFLANIGDSIQKAFYPIENKDSFSVSRIMYLKRANPINPLSDSIFVYSTNKDSAHYFLNFADVGLNKGNYVPLFVGTNGRAFQFIAPIGGIPQGNFEPAQFLVTPKKQEIIAINSQFNHKKTQITTDFAVSNYDINTFSSKEKSNDKGFAAKINLDNTTDLKNSKFIITNAAYEWVNENYKPLERLRSVEFSRDWGLPIIPTQATEHLPKVSVTLRDKKNNNIGYSFKAYIRNDGFSASKHNFFQNHTLKLININSDISIVDNKSTTDKGYFFRPNFTITKNIDKEKGYFLAINYSLEYNVNKFLLTDTLTPLSFSFETISASLKSNENKLNKWSVTYFTRADKLPNYKTLIATDRSHNYNVAVDILSSSKHQFKTSLTYRQLNVFNAQLSKLKPDNTLLGRAEYTINEWKGFIVGNILYELGAGQEQRRDINYIEVPAGRGEFTWIDYNNDGIQQLNEFEIAVFQDQAKYVRIFTPTNQFLKANYTQFNYSVMLMPRAIISSIKNKKVGEFIAKFIVQSTLQTSKKNLSSGAPTFNPFSKNEFDTALINFSKNSNNTLSFNRFSNRWGIDFSQLETNVQSLLTFGLENRTNKEYNLKARLAIKQQYSFEWIQKWGINTLTTPKFSNRNFNLSIQSFEPKIAYTNSTKYRLTASFVQIEKSNALINGGEKSSSQALNVELKYNAVQSSSFLAKFTSNKISYTGQPNSTISYIILDGLLPGQNYLWTIEFTKRLNNNLEINFSYEGRKPGETRIINLGRASVRAIL